MKGVKTENAHSPFVSPGPGNVFFLKNNNPNPPPQNRSASQYLITTFLGSFDVGDDWEKRCGTVALGCFFGSRSESFTRVLTLLKRRR